MKIKEGGGMDAQQQKFELAIKEAFPNSPQYLNKNPDGTYRNTTTFGAWIGWKLAAKAQAVPEGYILIPKKMPDEVNDHLWDFMTDNFVCTNDYGDSFMACDDFNLDKFYAELVKAQEPAND